MMRESQISQITEFIEHSKNRKEHINRMTSDKLTKKKFNTIYKPNQTNKEVWEDL
jgi:hypothetical protein